MFKKIVNHFHYWYFVKPFTWLKIQVYYLKQPRKIANLSFKSRENEKMDLIVVSFNNEKVIELQIARLAKYFKEPYELIIIDNSSDEQKSLLIQALCAKNKVSYLKLPKQSDFKISASHAIGLNWVYRNLIKKRKPKYFGFLDHDVFPIESVRVKQYLEKQKFYGLKHYGVNNSNLNIWDENTPEYWYLWAGFSFFRFDAIANNKRIDFMPLHIHNTFFDTGGSNWLSLYSPEDRSKLQFCRWRREQCADGDIVDVIDDKWVHTMNGSDWRNLKKRPSFIEEVLSEFENKIA